MTSFGPTMPGYTVLGPGVRRLLAPNPSMMTGPGTNTYLFGINEVAVLDPGPVIEAHLQAILDLAAAPIRCILVTHTHPDHSPAAAELAERTGAKLLGSTPPGGKHQDLTFKPDRELGDGDRVEVDGIELEVIHTPGHASNHLCYRHLALNWVFTGDHVIDGSTVVIDPPDGNMTDYLRSLRQIKTLNPTTLMPGHGEPLLAPLAAIDALIAHRLRREAKVLAALRLDQLLTLDELVQSVYDDVDAGLHGVAARSLLAHLLKLESDERAVRDATGWRRR